MKLYNFFRSGTSHRLRIALNFKGLDYEYVAVDLRQEEHRQAPFMSLNPQALVPVLQDGDLTLAQTPAILEWLDEAYPARPMLPEDIRGRSRVRALAALIGCDIHPVNNRRILEYLRHEIGCGDDAVNAWCARWINDGFAALEVLLAADPARGRFCYADVPTLADIYLVPQVESARRFQVDLTPYPCIVAVDAACSQIAAFRLAAPALQADAPHPAP